MGCEKIAVKEGQVVADFYPHGVPDETVAEIADFLCDPEKLSDEDYRMRFFGIRSPYHETAVENCLKNCRARMEKNDSAVLLLRDPESGEIECCVDSGLIDKQRKVAEIGFATSRPHRGKGLAKAGVLRVLDFWQNEGDAADCIAYVDFENRSSDGLLRSVCSNEQYSSATRKFVDGEIQWTIPLNSVKEAA